VIADGELLGIQANHAATSFWTKKMKITIINNLYYNEILKKDNEFSHRKNKFYDGKKKDFFVPMSNESLTHKERKGVFLL
ncbi:hypothetical protein, partial [Benzoatithermus flavus]